MDPDTGATVWELPPGAAAVDGEADGEADGGDVGDGECESVKGDADIDTDLLGDAEGEAGGDAEGGGVVDGEGVAAFCIADEDADEEVEGDAEAAGKDGAAALALGDVDGVIGETLVVDGDADVLVVPAITVAAVEAVRPRERVAVGDGESDSVSDGDAAVPETASR